ncbi:protein MAIN-LIKE 1-like [Lathyrus oleraceus]|uniref:protein MAIN-LIKE 1-like n=1 Tax=Pisum sativum TaxID=3888 RepID=UPI0021CF981C|nr:protein MAIN-LIKE 1-like [Pisum sativum]
MESWVSRSGLASLQRTSLNKIDTNLVSAFVERWHLETSSFHMPFGEMSITLDDVACLLHLPIRGIFWSPQDVIEELAVELVVDYLGVSQGQAQSHVRSCRGSYYKLECVGFTSIFQLLEKEGRIGILLKTVVFPER